MEAQELFQQNLGLIDEVCSAVCRRHSCFPPDSEDFTSQVRLALMDDDYARLRRFGGRSRFKTYLTSVVSHLFLDHRNKTWGRWRPSQVALQLGDTARQLDQLLYRDGFSLDEAIGLLRTNLKVDASEAEIRDLAERLPVRTHRRFESDESLEFMPSDQDPEADLLQSEQAERVRQAHQALQAALQDLQPSERLVLKMRYDKGLTVTQIAKVLRRERRRLYTELDRLLRDLRRRLQEQGFAADDVLGVEGWLS